MPAATGFAHPQGWSVRAARPPTLRRSTSISASTRPWPSRRPSSSSGRSGDRLHPGHHDLQGQRPGRQGGTRGRGHHDPDPLDSSDPASATKATNHVGDTVLVADWQVKVTKVVLNDDRALHAANQFNDKPKRGTHYVLVDYTAKYTGSERTADTEFDLDWNLTQRDAKVLDDTFEDTGHNYTTKARKGGTVRGEVLFEAASPTLVSVSDILGNDYADFSV